MDIKNLSKEHIMHTYGRFDVVLKEGKGVHVKDSDGKEYIDLGSGIGVNSLGFCDEGWVSTICQQASTLQHTSNLYYTYPSTLLAEKLTKNSHFDKVFFGNSGAEANECAIKLARKYSYEKYGENRNEIITLEQSFHGRTVTTLAATGQEQFHKFFFPFTEGFQYAKPNDLESLKEKITDKTCAIFIECIQGEGGVNILDKDFVQGIERICQENDLVFIVDEVQTGIGRTGSMYAFEQFDVKPDVITLAKGLGGGLPIGACLCTEEYKEVLSLGHHGTTFGGNPVSCAGASYIMDQIDEDFLKKVQENGDYFAEELKKLSGVKEVRHMGLIIGILLENKKASDVAKNALKEGLLVLTAKDLVRLLPPLTITKDEIDEAIKRFKKVL